jgi:energy-coupling factor transporter ATP-binding protein EcfA2
MASIVAMDTPVLVFDEPTAGLDPYEISLPIATLKKLQSENKTVIVISHDMDFVAENISRVISLADGRKVFDGSVRNLFSNSTKEMGRTSSPRPFLSVTVTSSSRVRERIRRSPKHVVG